MMGMSAIGIMSLVLRPKRLRSRSATARMRWMLNSNMIALLPHDRRHLILVLARCLIAQAAAGVVDEHVLERGLEERHALHLVSGRLRRLGGARSPPHVARQDQLRRMRL